MRGLLVLGGIALCILVAASHQDQAESGIEAKNERVQGDFVNDRVIRSTGDENKKKPKPPRKPGMFSAMGRPSNTREKRSIEESTPTQVKPKKCRGCYTPLVTQKEAKQADVSTLVLRQLRDTEEHEKLKKKQKHLKEKSKSKRRRNKNHKEKHAHFQREDSEISHNDKRRKPHRGKDKGHHRTGGLSAIAIAPPDMKKMRMDKHDTKDRTE